MSRLRRFRELLLQEGLKSFLVTRPSNRCYLSGFTPEDPQEGETAGMLFISENKAILATDPRYAEIANQVGEFEPFIYSGNFFEQILTVLQQMPSPMGFESHHLTCAFKDRLERAIKQNQLGLELIPTEYLIEILREVKDEDEINLLKQAAELTESVYLHLRQFLKPGLMEKEVAWEIERYIRQDLGASMSFEPIVACGANAAIPHAQPGDNQIKSGQPIIIDCGVKYQGYCADMTRTFFIGQPDERYKKVYKLVLQAQSQAMSLIKAGLATWQVDTAAREVFIKNGMQEYFLHALGHGVGLLVHEPPSLSPRKPGQILKENMVVTIEPGLYLSGWGGVRIEDMVVVKQNKSQQLTQLSRQLEDWVLT